MKHIKSFSRFLLSEALHIHDDMDEISNYIYTFIKGKDIGLYEINNLKSKLNINKIIIKIANMPDGVYGEFLINKSKLTKNGWIFYVNLKKNVNLSTIKHEMDHALRLILQPKEDILNKMNYLKGSYILNRTQEIDYFFYMIYLSSMDETNAMIKEFHGILKEEMYENNVKKLNKYQFLFALRTSRPYEKSEEMIKFKMKDCFKGFSENNLNKLLYLYEENKKKLDKINKYSLFIRNIKLIIKGLFTDAVIFSDEPTLLYKPDKNAEYYEKWINSQGKKLRKTLYKLYDHYI